MSPREDESVVLEPGQVLRKGDISWPAAKNVVLPDVVWALLKEFNMDPTIEAYERGWCL